MDCDFTEEVSLLVDGELAPHEAARLRAHMEGCAHCQQAREAFLLLRQELRSYDRAPDPHAQSKALAAILDSRTLAGGAAASTAGVRVGTSTTPRGIVSRLSGSLTEVFSGRRLRPAHVATLALLLVATALGLRWLAGSYNSNVTRRPGTPALANTNSRPVQAAVGAEAGAKRVGDTVKASVPPVYQAQTRKPTHHAVTKPNPRGGTENAQVRRDGFRTGHERREDSTRNLQQEVARAGESVLQSSVASAAAMYAAGSFMTAADPALRIGRHAERVERLFRSFRNASLTESDPTLEVADARRLSKRLLYSNIALRREAAVAGDLPVEGLLDSLEPILLDISNLPNNPPRDAVGSIKERIRRRQLVGVLQAQAMLASKP
jgi:hypothetical protein